MCTIQCLLAFLAVSVNLVHSWDIAVTTGDQIEFYTNQTKTSNEGVRFKDLTALAYDAVQNMLLFVDRQNDNASIFSYNLLTKKYRPLVARRSSENIQGLAYDPITASMFWTDTNERSIYWMPLPPKSNEIYGKLLLKLVDEIPRAIAVDSCRGYIYWTNTNVTKPTIERARFDGTDRSTVIDTDIYMPVTLDIDQRTKRLYWADDKEGIHFSIESSDLNGKQRKKLFSGTYHTPNSLTVSKDTIYWVDWGYKSIWKISKTAPPNTEPAEVIAFSTEVPFGIVANYKIADQVSGIAECTKLLNFSPNTTIINDTVTTIAKYDGLFCLHGNKTSVSECKCWPGYSGDRCETSICYNFCLHGNCTISTEGTPSCECPKGYTGSRCEVNMCNNHCLNNGECSTNKNNKPVCTCLKEYEGKRCEIKKSAPMTVPIVVKETCNCTTEEPVANTTTSTLSNDEVYVDTSCNGEWDTIRDPILMVLGILCGLLCLVCAVLITKILNLKKRPRIKRRIIVNKNVTPLTARPDQCEITIENCCNMNICETPCFEPRNSIRPTLLDAKPGKEEKRNLIANMENPDDIY